MKSKFWGVEVEAKKSKFVSPGNGELIRICQIALGEVREENFESANHVVVSLIVEGKKSVFAILSAELVPQLSVDLVFETNFRLLHNWKEGSVYVCGYIVNEEEDEAPDGNGEPAIPTNIKAAASEPGSSAKFDDDDLDDSQEDDLSEDEMPEKFDDDDLDEDLSEDETPEKVVSSKNRPFGFQAKNPAFTKKSNTEAPQKTDGKRRRDLTATPYPAKKSKKETAAGIPESRAEFPCRFCNKTFKLEKGLEYHTKAKHGEEGSAHTATPYRAKKSVKKTVEIQYTCEICSKTFKSEAGFEDHSKAKHGTK